MGTSDTSCDVLIIGGGLAGLALADQLLGTGRSVHLVEARARPGGRVLTQTHEGAGYDLGPAWIWPGQPRIAALVHRLSLRTHEQWSAGLGLFEDASGAIHKMQGVASMAGSYRIDGGIGALTDALVAQIAPGTLSFGQPIVSLKQDAGGITCTDLAGNTRSARDVVLALPPRLAANLTFDPPLPDSAIAAMHAVPTWMAGHAKAVAIYPEPIWRSDGLSGDAVSQRGPLAEIHDATPQSGPGGAVFGFVGTPPHLRQDKAALRREISAQMTRLFGSAPAHILLKDWSIDPATSVQSDHAPLGAHPRYGMPSAMSGLWDNKLHFGGTEIATEFGGFLEGALEAAEQTAQDLA